MTTERTAELIRQIAELDQQIGPLEAEVYARQAEADARNRVTRAMANDGRPTWEDCRQRRFEAACRARDAAEGEWFKATARWLEKFNLRRDLMVVLKGA